MHIDWTGNKQGAFSTLGARNYAKSPRAENDYYATEPKATQVLLDVEKFHTEFGNLPVAAAICRKY